MFYLDAYVPPDERFSPKKLSEFIENSIQAAVHFLVPPERRNGQSTTTQSDIEHNLDGLTIEQVARHLSPTAATFKTMHPEHCSF